MLNEWALFLVCVFFFFVCIVGTIVPLLSIYICKCVYMCICDYAPSLCFLFFFVCFVLFCVFCFMKKREEKGRGGGKKNKKEPRSTYVPPGFAPIFVSFFFLFCYQRDRNERESTGFRGLYIEKERVSSLLLCEFLALL